MKALVYFFRLCFLMLLMSEGVGFAWRLQVGHFSGSEQQSGQHFGLFVNNFLFVIANAAKCEQRRKKSFVWKFGQIFVGLLFPSAVIYFSVFFPPFVGGSRLWLTINVRFTNLFVAKCYAKWVLWQLVGGETSRAIWASLVFLN